MSDSTDALTQRMTEKVVPWLKAQDQTNETIATLSALSSVFLSATDQETKERTYTAIRTMGGLFDSWPIRRGRASGIPVEDEAKMDTDASRIADYFLDLWNQDEDFRAVEKPHGKSDFEEYTSETYHATIKARYLSRFRKAYRAN